MGTAPALAGLIVPPLLLTCSGVRACRRFNDEGEALSCIVTVLSAFVLGMFLTGAVAAILIMGNQGWFTMTCIALLVAFCLILLLILLLAVRDSMAGVKERDRREMMCWVTARATLLVAVGSGFAYWATTAGWRLF